MNARQRTPLLPEQIEESRKLKAIYEARKADARARDGRLTQDDVAAACGWSNQSAVSQYMNGKIALNLEALLKLARALEFDPAEVSPRLAGQIPAQDAKPARDDSNVTAAPPMTAMVPEISWVQAGSFSEVCFIDLDPDSTNWYPRPPNCGPNAFALKVVGESMLEKYPPGRIIFVDPDVVPLSGDDVIAVMTETGEATFKRFIEEPGAGKMLKALNPAWKDPYISINGNCRITGVVMAQMELRQR